MLPNSHLSDEENAHPRRGGGPKLRVLKPAEVAAPELPYSLECEEGLLSCLFLDGPDVMPRCRAAGVDGTCFYHAAHAIIFEGLADLYQRGLPMELPVIAEELKTKGNLEKIGGYAFLTGVSSLVPTTMQAGYFIDKVREYAVRRAFIRGCEGTIHGVRGMTDSGEELGHRLEAHAAWASGQLDRLRAGAGTILDAAKAAYQRTLDKLAGKPDQSRHVFTGLREFDKRFGPFDANNEDWLVIIGAFPSDGKSSFLRCLLIHNLRAGKTALIFLLETGVGKLLENLACTAADVPSGTLAGLPKDYEERYRAALDEMHGYLGKTLFVCDDVIPAETVTARIDDHARRHGEADFYGVDHIHLLNSLKGFTKREPELGYIAKLLARCGKRHNRTIFGLAQLNRAARADGKNMRPEPHHLRDSGEIEQAARRIVLLHIPSQDMRGADQTKNQDQVMLELYQAKHNNGQTGYREFWFRRSLTKFFDIGDKELGAARAAHPSGNSPTSKDGFKK